MIKYVYPHLPSRFTIPIIRYSGSGLGNSLFVFARSIVFANEHGMELINPTWLNFDPVQWKMWSKDKRLYNDTFLPVGVTGLKRLRLLLWGKKIKEEDFKGVNDAADWVEIFYMKGFETIRDKSDYVREYLKGCLKEQVLMPLKSFDFTKKIAVHIRLGDYGTNALPMQYYVQLITQVHAARPEYEFLIFSDGSDKELKDVLDLPRTSRAYFGCAMSDILAIASCAALIGSHSTFTDP